MRSCLTLGYPVRAEGVRWAPLASAGREEPAGPSHWVMALLSMAHLPPRGGRGMHASGVPASDPQMKYRTEYEPGMCRCGI